MSTCSSITNYMFRFDRQSQNCTRLQNKTNTWPKSSFQFTSIFLFTFFSLLHCQSSNHIFIFIGAEKLWWRWRQPSEIEFKLFAGLWWDTINSTFPRPSGHFVCKLWLYQSFRATFFLFVILLTLVNMKMCSHQ